MSSESESEERDGYMRAGTIGCWDWVTVVVSGSTTFERLTRGVTGEGSVSDREDSDERLDRSLPSVNPYES